MNIKLMTHCIQYVQYLYDRYINGPKMIELGRNLLLNKVYNIY